MVTYAPSHVMTDEWFFICYIPYVIDSLRIMHESVHHCMFAIYGCLALTLMLVVADLANNETKNL